MAVYGRSIPKDAGAILAGIFNPVIASMLTAASCSISVRRSNGECGFHEDQSWRPRRTRGLSRNEGLRASGPRPGSHRFPVIDCKIIEIDLVVAHVGLHLFHGHGEKVSLFVA
jgi:hypothetical protein